MTQNQKHAATSRDDILMEFALSDQEPPNDRLAQYIATYPQYAVSLARLAAELEAFHAAPESELTQSEASEQQFAIQIALEGIEGAVATADPLATATPVQLQDLAAHLHANGLFITRLKDRVIDVASLSEGFLESVASFFETSVERIRASLSESHRIAHGTAFKAKGKPQATGKQSFEEALQSSGLTQEQQDHLRSL